MHYPLRPPPHRPPPSRRRSFPPHRRRFRFRPPRMRRRGTSCYYFHPLPSPPATTHDVRRRSPAPPRHRRRRIGESRGSGCGDVAFFMWRGKICLYVFMYMLYVSTRISKSPVLVRALPVSERVPVLVRAFFPMPVLVAGRFLRYPYAQSARSRTSTTQFVPVLVRSPASSRTGISLCPY